MSPLRIYFIRYAAKAAGNWHDKMVYAESPEQAEEIIQRYTKEKWSDLCHPIIIHEVKQIYP